MAKKKSKTKGKNNVMILTILGVIGFLMIVGFSMFFIMYDGDQKFEVNGSKTDAGISLANVYDENGDPISTDEQATVAGVSGVKYITLRVNAINKDTIPLSFNILEASPANFKTALNPPATNSAPAGSMASWISDLIDIQGMEGTTQVFSVTVEATSPARTTATKSFSVDIKIDEDPDAGFGIEIIGDAGEEPVFGEPPECTMDSHCGTDMICVDDLCVDDPDAPECATDADCEIQCVTEPCDQMVCENALCVDAPAPDQVQFRTTSLLYNDGAVAYASVCGQPLIAYGRTTGACTQYKCNNDEGSVVLPASYDLTTETFGWFDSTTACICEADDVGVNTYPRRYSTQDSEASEVDLALESKIPMAEVLCTP